VFRGQSSGQRVLKRKNRGGKNSKAQVGSMKREDGRMKSYGPGYLESGKSGPQHLE